MTRASAVRAVALVIGVALIGPVQAAAHRSPARHAANNFTGECSLSGTSAFSPPLTGTAQPTTQTAQATGTCTGTFVGRNGRSHQLSNAPVSYRATEFAPSVSCDGGSDSGSGTISFPYGPIRFTISETRVVAVAVVTLQGAKGGSASGQANVSPTGNPEQVLAACNAGGLASAPFDARAATTPSISG